MTDITAKEMEFVIRVFKSPEKSYNASSIAKPLGLSRMGSLKIAKRLVLEDILSYREHGRGKYYHLNYHNEFVPHYLRFLLKREAEHAHPFVRMWVDELKKLKSADAAILFGSALRKFKDANDIDALLITGASKFSKLKKEVEEINTLNVKKLHPIYQSREDFSKNVNKKDEVVINALKGLVAFGEDLIIELLKT
ncbi:hypothetical protein HYV84_03110 [Candidatus Woesearchaeota archaeon]|nr:hypothetical protein [Candidatus Woesearchaeota archaeon]